MEVKVLKKKFAQEFFIKTLFFYLSLKFKNKRIKSLPKTLIFHIFATQSGRP